jgi:hypothetical protein
MITMSPAIVAKGGIGTNNNTTPARMTLVDCWTIPLPLPFEI